MLSSVLVVVIVGAIIAVITGATLRGGPKPATPRPDPKRTAAPRHAKRSGSEAPPSPIDRIDPVRPTTRPAAGAATPEVVDLQRTPRERLRALSLLVLTVVTLGSAAAALLGTIVVVGARVLDRALG